MSDKGNTTNKPVIDRYDPVVAYIPTPLVRYLLASNLMTSDIAPEGTWRVILTLLRTAFTPSEESTRPTGTIATDRFVDICASTLGLSTEQFDAILVHIEAIGLIRQSEHQIIVTVPPSLQENAEPIQAHQYSVEQLQELLGWI